MKTAVFCALLCCISTGVGASEIYKCTTSTGKTVFSDAPCKTGDTVSTLSIAAPKASQTDTEGTQARQRLNDAAHSMFVTRRQGELKAAIRDGEQQVISLQKSMDVELFALRTSTRYSNNNLAGATRDQAIMAEIEAVSKQYQLKIDAAKARVQSAKDELASLK